MVEDILDMDWINNLPQPIIAIDGKFHWPVYDFEVQTGLYRIDVCGLLQVCHIGDHFVFKDGNGVEYGYEDFFSDAIRPSLAVSVATP